jgi:hypothetical protein
MRFFSVALVLPRVLLPLLLLLLAAEIPLLLVACPSLEDVFPLLAVFFAVAPFCVDGTALRANGAIPANKKPTITATRTLTQLLNITSIVFQPTLPL